MSYLLHINGCAMAWHATFFGQNVSFGGFLVCRLAE